MNFSKYNYINKSINSIDNMNNSSLSQQRNSFTNGNKNVIENGGMLKPSMRF